MNDASRGLRYRLGELCGRYNSMIADKDTLDFRLGSPEAFGETTGGTNAEAAYLNESRGVSGDIRTLIVEMIDLAQQIRNIEGF